MTSRPERPLPATDGDSAPWWAGVAEHQLRLQRCRDCDAFRWPARALCNRCGSLHWTWEAASGRATVASWIVNEHSFSEAFAAPYVVVLARLEEQDDVLVPGAYGGAPDGHDVSIGDRIEVAFDDVVGPDGQLALLRWRPVASEAQ